MDIPGDALVPLHEGPRGSLPRVDQCGIVLPSELWITSTWSTWAHHCLIHSTLWKTTMFLTYLRLHAVAFSRTSSLPSPSSWPGTASFALLPLSMPPGNSCRAGGWHTGCKPRVGILCVIFPCGIPAVRSCALVVCLLLGCILSIRCGFYEMLNEVALIRSCPRKLVCPITCARLLSSVHTRQARAFPCAEFWTHHLLSLFAAFIKCEDGFVV